MKTKILFVDDDANVLMGYQRQLRKSFEIDVAPGGVEGLEMISQHGPYAVVVADMRMPHMNGIEFLSRVLALAPDTTRMMLTGNADQQTAINAVNEGYIFRFMSKPCAPETITAALEAGIRQYQLVTAEAELLEKTLIGSVNVLTEILCLADPIAFRRSKRLRDYVRETAGVVKYPNRWELELAALLSQIGHLTVPAEIAAKEHDGSDLTKPEEEVLNRVPEIGFTLLRKIPRLDALAQIIRYQNKLFNGAGFPLDATSGERIPLGSRVLKILIDLIDLEAGGTPRTVALRLMRNRQGKYDTNILDAVATHFVPPLFMLAPQTTAAAAPMMRKVKPEALTAIEEEGPENYVEVGFDDLLVDDLLISDIVAQDGSLLLSKGNVITEVVLERLKNYARVKGVREPIHVAASAEETEDQPKAA